MEILGYIASILMGLSLGLIGGGGSILTVPILVYLFQLDPVISTAYSLFIVGLTALVGGITYFKKGSVDLKTGFLFAIPSFVGVYISRAYLVPSIPNVISSFSFFTYTFELTKAIFIMLLFAVLMIAASYSMIRKKKKLESNIDIPKKINPVIQKTIIGLEGLVVGGITGLVGAGGGFLIIPALVVLVGLPMKIAVGTSLFIIAIKSLFGFIGDIQRQVDIDWILLLNISFIAIIGLFIGIQFSKKVDEAILKKGFGYFVLVMGLIIFVDQLV